MKQKLLFPGLALALLATPLTAQSQDDGAAFRPMLGSASSGFGGRGAGCGSGTTTTFFAQNNGFAGNMFDIAIGASDMTIECLDVNSTSVVGTIVDIEVWAVPGTCVGKDLGDLCANGWVKIATGSGTAAGSDVPTPITLTPVGSAHVFAAGTTHGIYVNFANYSTSRCGYTNASAPVSYTGTHCDLTTYYGKATFLPPCTAGSTFTFREFNGTLYTEVAGPPPPTLTITGSCPGPVTLDMSNMTPSNAAAILYGAAGAFTKPSGTCAGLTLGISSPSLLAVVATNPSGAASLAGTAPAGACGVTVQAVDIATCTATNTAIL